MDRIAFFWIGDDITIPSILVESILNIYENNIEIIQLTNYETNRIPGVTKSLRANLSQDIMVARLQAYSLIPSDDQLTFFVDADSILLNKINLTELDSNLKYFVLRENMDDQINHLYPEFYPEFIGKKMGEVMPFLFGAMVMANGNIFFHDLLKKCLNLPARFHRWYGDQIALYAKILEENPNSYKYLDIKKHLFIVRSGLEIVELKKLKNHDVKFITFKGPESKKFMHQTLSNLKNIV